jgi:CHAD domain-containing protein
VTSNSYNPFGYCELRDLEVVEQALQAAIDQLTPEERSTAKPTTADYRPDSYQARLFVLHSHAFSKLQARLSDRMQRSTKAIRARFRQSNPWGSL